ncbi:MAG TPA: 3-dehydroquinate synthase, partial [Candidatus Woesebacteria bacterium]|nr:3-dehydroquinate synthase [Candidatus Woesebacteria bacterium]
MDPIETVKVYTIIHTHSYKIFVGKDVFAQIGEVIDLEKYSQIIIITDAKVGRRYLDEAERQLRKYNKNISSYTVDSGEKNKNLETVTNIYRALIKKKIDRKGLIVNLGGGVISDMGSFAASTFLRGIPFINLPTTFEAMVDASVGGKTGVNFENYKNYIGSYAQPEGVFAEITTLETLPERILLQGQAEAIKHGLIADADFFEKITSRKINEFPEDQLIEIIAHSIQLKANLIHQDEKEETVRRLLHFGHIIGHALESLSHKTENPLYHGEAVAIGMVAEAKISQLMGMLPDDEFEIIERSIERVGLPIRYEELVSVEKVLEMIQTDKKSLSGNIKWNLLHRIGKADFNIEVG